MQWIFEEHYKWEAVLIIKYIEKEKKRALQMRYNEQFVVEKLHLFGAKKFVVVCVCKEEYYCSICADFICIAWTNLCY